MTNLNVITSQDDGISEEKAIEMLSQIETALTNFVRKKGFHEDNRLGLVGGGDLRDEDYFYVIDSGFRLHKSTEIFLDGQIEINQEDGETLCHYDLFDESHDLLVEDAIEVVMTFKADKIVKITSKINI